MTSRVLLAEITCCSDFFGVYLIFHDFGHAGCATLLVAILLRLQAIFAQQVRRNEFR